jgi:hypothetical protein
MKFFKKKKYSGNSVIRKYEATNTSRIFSRGVIKQILILYTRIQMDQTNKEKYLNQFSFNNHEFNFLMLVNDEH